jgi:hypothetical protein
LVEKTLRFSVKSLIIKICGILYEWDWKSFKRKGISKFKFYPRAGKELTTEIVRKTFPLFPPDEREREKKKKKKKIFIKKKKKKEEEEEEEKEEQAWSEGNFKR